MKLRLNLLGATALALAAVRGQRRRTLPACDDCADAMTVVSWGGAYQTSQQKAYTEPYAALTGRQHHLGRKLERGGGQAARAVRGRQRHLGPRRRRGPRQPAPLRRGPGDGDRLRRRRSRPAPTARRRRADFGDVADQRVLHPADRLLDHLRLSHRRRRVERRGARPRSARSSTSTTFPGKRSLEKRPKKNLEWALLCDGVAKDDLYDVLSTPTRASTARSPSSTPSRTRRVWWSAGAETPQLLADGEVVMGSTYNGRLFSVIEEQKQPVAHALGLAGLRLRRLDRSGRPARGPAEPGDELPPLRHRHPAPRRPGQVHLLRPGPRLVAAAGRRPCRRSASRWRRTCRPTRPTRRTTWSTTSSGGPTTRTRSRPLPGLARPVSRLTTGGRGRSAPPAIPETEATADGDAAIRPRRASGPMLAADGTPLKTSLRRALRRAEAARADADRAAADLRPA